MNLVASMIVRNELGRYLKPCVTSLLGFCDEIRVLDDASTDGTGEWLTWECDSRVAVERQSDATFYVHEGHTRQRLLEWTLQAKPTHILAIDADEFIDDGDLLRATLTDLPSPVHGWRLCMQEAWTVTDDTIGVRIDGGWRPHLVPCVYAPPPIRTSNFAIQPRRLACGREPMNVRSGHGRAPDTGASIIHFGWANPHERQRRYDRYAEHDQGRFHANTHLQSILWDEARIDLCEMEWPEALPAHAILDAARRIPQ